MASETRYLVINTIPDPENMEGFQLYLSKIIPIFQSCGGKPLGRWKTEEQILGDGGIKASAVFEFPSAQVIRVEVKASRAVDGSSSDPLIIKALASDSTKRFDMNFQQLKPRHCDVFVWVAVWRDVIRYWVMTSKEVECHKDFSKGQHKGNTGERQLHITDRNIRSFDGFLTASDKLGDAIRAAFKRQVKKG